MSINLFYDYREEYYKKMREKNEIAGKEVKIAGNVKFLGVLIED